MSFFQGHSAGKTGHTFWVFLAELVAASSQDLVCMLSKRTRSIPMRNVSMSLRVFTSGDNALLHLELLVPFIYIEPVHENQQLFANVRGHALACMSREGIVSSNLKFAELDPSRFCVL